MHEEADGRMQQLGIADVEAAFEEMGDLLHQSKKVVEIAVYEGAAILLEFEVEFRTGDVDAHVSSGDHGAVMDAARRVAERHGWLRSWFSEAVTAYLSGAGELSLHRAYPSPSRAGLRVYVAVSDYLLAMKLRAMRVGSRDEGDATMLASASGITTFPAMIALLSQYFPKEPPDQRRVAIVKQFAESLNETPS